jgi:hypothetical protein
LDSPPPISIDEIVVNVDEDDDTDDGRFPVRELYDMLLSPMIVGCLSRCGLSRASW